jgi:hypothetical protein
MKILLGNSMPKQAGSKFLNWQLGMMSCHEISNDNEVIVVKTSQSKVLYSHMATSFSIFRCF